MKPPMAKLMLAAFAATLLCLGTKAATVHLSSLDHDYTAQNGDILTGTQTKYAISIADGATVTLAGMYSKGLTCYGDATIILADDTVNTLSDTLQAGPVGTTLTIQGNTGSLAAYGQWCHAGIGSMNRSCGNIRIEGGIITATADWQAAGIGPHFDNNHANTCGDITITGGTIIARGNGFGAGIGASDTGPCGKIEISGGTVTAIGGDTGPGIGGNTAQDGTCESITISGGTVYATGHWEQCSRSAIGWNCGDIRIDGTIAKVVATINSGTPISSRNGTVTISDGLRRTDATENGMMSTTLIPKAYYREIVWQNEDGTTLYTSEVACGDVPVYKGAWPTKRTGNTSVFAFTEWSPAIEAVASNTTYTAQFAPLPEVSGGDWMVVDLKTGGVACYGCDLALATNLFNTAEFKLSKMAFRRVPEGNYYVRDGAAVATMERPYYIGMFPVTVAQYNLMLDPAASVSETAENLRAVANVSYADLRGSETAATVFGGGLGYGPIARLNALATAKLGPFDLPTESMWEVSARAIEAGSETNKTWPWFFGASDSSLSQYAFFNGSSEADAYDLTSGPRVPGCKLPNAWGLYDIYGNVWEFCLDTCPGGTSSESMSLSQTPQTGYTSFRILGGAYSSGSDRCRASNGGGWANNAQGKGANIGFRLAMICDDVPTYTISWINTDGTTNNLTLVEGSTPSDGKSLTFAVKAGTSASDVKLKLGGNDVTKGFRVTVDGTEARAVLLAPYEVPKEEGAPNEIWTENGDGTVTLNVTVVPGLYYAADSAASLDAFKCPGASAPATDATTLAAPKPVGGTGFFKVWVSDKAIDAE